MATSKKQLYQVQETARDLFEGAAEKGKDYYEFAKEWLPENYDNPWFIGSAVTVAGVLGFFIGRSISSSKKSEKSYSSPFDEERIMKFARLWLLYRATR